MSLFHRLLFLVGGHSRSRSLRESSNLPVNASSFALEVFPVTGRSQHSAQRFLKRERPESPPEGCLRALNLDHHRTKHSIYEYQTARRSGIPSPTAMQTESVYEIDIRVLQHTQLTSPVGLQEHETSLAETLEFK